MQAEITDFEILASYTSDALDNLVRKRLKEGWQPLGPARMVADYVVPENGERPDISTDFTWYISMVKYS